MSQIFAIHKDNPEARLLRQAVFVIRKGGLLVYPTDSGYALGCALGNQEALDRMRSLRQLDKSHHMTLVCNDLSNLEIYAKVSLPIISLLKAFTPGAYTFILRATQTLSDMMMHPERTTVGLRVPDHPVALALLECLDAPLISTSLILPGAHAPLSEPAAVRDLLGHQIDLLIDAGSTDVTPTTVVDLTHEYPVIIREGKGAVAPFK